MKSKSLIMLLAGISLFFAPGSAFAHHGTAEFDKTRPATVRGTVTDFVWTNPHGTIELEVHDSKGNVEKWQGFLTSPNFLARAGWSKSTLKPGDEVTLTGSPSKSHPNILKVTRVQLANGQELRVGALGGM